MRHAGSVTAKRTPLFALVNGSHFVRDDRPVVTFDSGYDYFDVVFVGCELRVDVNRDAAAAPR